MKIKVGNISGLLESNNFLRAFWAELRNRFGKCAWNYQPHKDGCSQTIFLGWADINQERTIPISLTYSQRTIIKEIHFGEQFGKSIDESSELAQQLKNAAEKAYQRRNSPDTQIFQLPVSSLYRSFSPYSGQWFEILPAHQHPISIIRIKVKSFDYVDAKAEFLRISSHLLDVLSVETNSLFWLSGQEDSPDITSDMESEKLACPEVNTFVSDEEWMDDIPSCNRYLLISSQAVRFIDRILSKNELSAEEDVFIRSCHHFHAAREQDASVYDRLIPSGELRNEDGVTFSFQEHPRFKSSVTLSRQAKEIATVLYMSAIEVASTIGSDPSERCKTCGQEQYKISARVVSYVEKYLELEKGHHLSKVFKSHYKKRSKYLHAGIVLSDHSYTGVTIPRLNPSSDSGVSENTSVLVTNLREWIGYMLRQQLKSM